MFAMHGIGKCGQACWLSLNSSISKPCSGGNISVVSIPPLLCEHTREASIAFNAQSQGGCECQPTPRARRCALLPDAARTIQRAWRAHWRKGAPAREARRREELRLAANARREWLAACALQRGVRAHLQRQRVRHPPLLSVVGASRDALSRFLKQLSCSSIRCYQASPTCASHSLR